MRIRRKGWGHFWFHVPPIKIHRGARTVNHSLGVRVWDPCSLLDNSPKSSASLEGIFLSRKQQIDKEDFDADVVIQTPTNNKSAQGSATPSSL